MRECEENREELAQVLNAEIRIRWGRRERGDGRGVGLFLDGYPSSTAI